jgi:tyrosyl-tRNA synthetase
MNLEISKKEASFISVAIMYFLSKIEYLDILTDMYPEINVKEILTRLSHIQQLSENELDYAEARKKLSLKE